MLKWGFYFFKGSFFYEFGIPFVRGTFFYKLKENRHVEHKFHYDPKIRKGH